MTSFLYVTCICALFVACTAKALEGNEERPNRRRQVVETLPPGVVEPKPDLPITKIGCFQDRSGDRALPLLIANYRSSSYFDWFDMPKIIQKCAHAAKDHGYSWFSVQFYGECWSSPSAAVTYDKHGPSKNCWNGVGKHWTNMVYKITVEAKNVIS